MLCDSRMVKIIKSLWWEFKIIGENLNSQLPLCFLAHNIYVEWYYHSQFIQGWIQCASFHGPPTSRLHKSIDVVYTRTKYSNIIKTFPLGECERFSVGTFVPRKERKDKGSAKPLSGVAKRAPRRSKSVAGASFYKLTPDHLLPIRPEKVCYYNTKNNDMPASGTTERSDGECTVIVSRSDAGLFALAPAQQSSY